MSLSERIKSCTCHLAGSPSSGPVYRLVMEITNACTLRCVMCPRNFMRRPVGHMDPVLFETVIRENRRSLEFVSLNGYGEPLLSPHLQRCISVCRDAGVASGISTNCTTLTRENARKLLDNPPDLLILAVDAVDQESYERVRVGARFDEVIRNVKGFLDMWMKTGKRPFVVVQSICMSETIHQVDDFKKAFKDYPSLTVRIRQLTFSGLARKDRDYRNRQGACYWLWTEPMILWDGTVVPCCQDVNGDLALGHIKDKRLSTLWEKGRIHRLRAAHGMGNRDSLALCKGCNMYQPGHFLAAAAALFDTARTNRLVPRVETFISGLRYRYGSGEKRC